MKIKETIERECCTRVDLRPYQGKQSGDPKRRKLQFCLHCGQIHEWDTQRDAAGGTESILIPIQI